jgi:uncharacterized membrane protein YvlD (DUF360 family)
MSLNVLENVFGAHFVVKPDPDKAATLIINHIESNCSMIFTSCFPFIILTLGLFTLVINTMMLGITAYLSDSLNLGFHISGFWPTFKGALLVSIVSTILNCLAGLSIPLREK